MESPDILEMIKRRRDSLNNSTSINDPSEMTVTRAAMTRLLADEYIGLLREIEKPTEKLKEYEVVRLTARPKNLARFFR